MMRHSPLLQGRDFELNVEINPTDAAELKVHLRDMVKVKTLNGETEGPDPCDRESSDMALVSLRRLLIIQPPVSQSAASWQQNIPTREAATRKYLPIFDSYLDSIIANSSPEIATAINKTTSWPSLEN
ncbi:MAG: hypothetical protein E4G89_06495 [Methanothrix sp.]|nr:MAG: hypothetical protein E4G89_06495 [Methanothrix sp.]